MPSHLSPQGLLKVHWDTKKVEVLSNRISASSPLAPNTPLMYANDIDIAADGTIWFTASVNVYPHRSAQWTDGIWHIPSLLGQPGFYDTWKGWGLGLCQGLPKGQLLTYNPRTKETKVVKEGFWYSNGVALSEAEDYIAMSETDRIRVLKIWLKGPKVSGWRVACQEPVVNPLYHSSS
jgi:sugar lactone lactonase YvrE